MASFSLAPDAAVDLAWRLGLSLNWLLQDTNGGSSASPGVTIWRCQRCGVAFFPQRLMCPRCHGHSWRQNRVHDAVIEEVSTIHHMIGATNWTPRRIASVRTAN